MDNLLKQVLNGGDIRNSLLENEKEKDDTETDKVSGSLPEKVWKFFENNPDPSDEKVHEFAEKLGMEPDELETVIYSLVSALVNTGRARLNNFTDADAEELKAGMKIEEEHIDKKSPFAGVVTRKIATDHLSETKDYYLNKEYGLLAMEKMSKKGKS